MGRGTSKAGGGGGFKLIENAREFNSTAAADQFFGDNLANLTDKEKNALTWYTGGAYEAFNDSLRKGGAEGVNHPNRLKSMDAAMAKSVLTEPITVTRGSTADLLGFSHTPTTAELKGLIGGEFVDRAFVSSSAKSGAGFSWKPITYKITVPPGKGRGQYIEHISHFKGGTEVEFLINRNSKFRVTNVSESGGKPVVHLQIVD